MKYRRVKKASFEGDSHKGMHIMCQAPFMLKQKFSGRPENRLLIALGLCETLTLDQKNK